METTFYYIVVSLTCDSISDITDKIIREKIEKHKKDIYTGSNPNDWRPFKNEESIEKLLESFKADKNFHEFKISFESQTSKIIEKIAKKEITEDNISDETAGIEVFIIDILSTQKNDLKEFCKHLKPAMANTTRGIVGNFCGFPACATIIEKEKHDDLVRNHFPGVLKSQEELEHFYPYIDSQLALKQLLFSWSKERRREMIILSKDQKLVAPPSMGK